MDKNSLMSI